MNIIYNLETNLQENKNTIFLAGSTSRTDATNSWRKDAIKQLSLLGFDGNIIVPEPRDGNLQDTNFDKGTQIEWERKYLSIANVILFWIPRTQQDLGLTSNIEFGEWYKTGKCTLGFPVDSFRTDYLKYIYKEIYQLESCYTLEDLCRLTLDKLNRPSKTWFTSDTHYSSDRTRIFSKRDFPSTETMDNALISAWNSCVYEQDVIYHLGDFGRANTLKNLSGKTIYFLKGNYDRSDELKSYDTYTRLKEIDNMHNFNGINLVHEPLNATDSTKFYLFGHIHSNQKVKRNALNVGCDLYHFKPIDLETVIFYKEAIEKHYDENVFVDRLGR